MELSYEHHCQTSVPLLKCDEDLIETLEDHQVNTYVTGMCALYDFMCDLYGSKAQQPALEISGPSGALICKC